MSATVKLTKKQKKGIAFRERKTGNRRSKDGNEVHNSEDNDVPVMEDQDALATEGASVEMAEAVERKKSKSASKVSGDDDQAKGKRKAEADEANGEPSNKPNKRKRQDADVDAPDSAEEKPVAKRKKSVEDTGESGQHTKLAVKSKQRFILFLGNLKYTTTHDAIAKHFSVCDPPPTIRLLTPKSTSGKPKIKSKGCAFLEFTHRNALQQGLKMHQSELDGRMINVELTAGGGGKSESRLEKVRERNKQLLDQRKEKIQKLPTSDASVIPTMPDKPQRYSATSGIKKAPSKRRTWTVGDVDDEETHRGGKKHSKHSRPKPSGKMWGTGVNAIPVG